MEFITAAARAASSFRSAGMTATEKMKNVPAMSAAPSVARTRTVVSQERATELSASEPFPRVLERVSQSGLDLRGARRPALHRAAEAVQEAASRGRVVELGAEPRCLRGLVEELPEPGCRRRNLLAQRGEEGAVARGELRRVQVPALDDAVLVGTPDVVRGPRPRAEDCLPVRRALGVAARLLVRTHWEEGGRAISHGDSGPGERELQEPPHQLHRGVAEPLVRGADAQRGGHVV